MASGDKGSILAKFIQLVPTSEANVPNGAMFYDQANANSLTNKSTGGTPVTVGAAPASDALIKSMKNMSGAQIPAGAPVAKKSDGTIILADANGVGTTFVIGSALAAINDGAFGNVALVGPNIPGALASLGVPPGVEIYLSTAGGYTTDAGSFDPQTDTIIMMGISDCSSGVASAFGVDLILAYEVISRPIA